MDRDGRALRRGAFAIVAGEAISMPSEATRWFVEALKGVGGLKPRGRPAR